MPLALATGLKRTGTKVHVRRTVSSSMFLLPASKSRWRVAILHGSLETFGGPQRHAIAHLKAGKMVIPNMSSVMLGKSVLF